MAQSTPPNTGIMNWLGNTLASTLGVNPNTPVAQLLQSAQPKAVPAQLAKPPVVAQPAATNTLGPIVNNQVSIPLPTTSSTAVPVNANSNIPPTYNGVDLYDSENTVSENIGQFGRSIWDTLTEWPQVSDTIADVGNSITQNTGQTVSGIVGGFTGNPSTFDPNADPGTKEDQRYAQGMLVKQQAIKQQISQQAQLKVEKDKSASDALKASVAMDPSKFLPQLGSEKRDKVDKTAWDMLSGWVSGIEWEDMLSGAADSLGELWEDPAIKSALIYYAGSRMMGYSASGSGMAAGEMYVKGVENQAKIDLATGKANTAAAVKKTENDTIDMSQTRQMFDLDSREIYDVYKSKSGRYQQVGSDEIIERGKTNLVDYKSGTHKTHQDLISDITDKVVGTASTHMNTLLSDSNTEDQHDSLRRTHGDGRAARELVQIATAEMKAQGRDYSNSSFVGALQNLVNKSMDDQVKGDRTGDYGKDMASMLGEWEEIKLKQGLDGSGRVPGFVYDKVKWGDGGKITEDKEEFKSSGVAKAALRNNLFNMRDNWISVAEQGNVNPAEARSKITSTRVAQELSGVFKRVVMSDPLARKYWTDVAEDSDNQNAFMMWMTSGTTGMEDKYLGLNSPLVKAEFTSINFNKKYKYKP
tara:strand:- start:7833 stop:9755 length:1923 start_codon:yes stop_codon:yes gene_type:complete